jgi:phosphoribosylaminoimidazolecarboxamide formyltransferase/IMP cyclohydrolase
MFSPKKNMRVLEADFSHKVDSRDLRTNVFGYLMQDRDTLILDKNNLKVMTKRKPTAREWKDMKFAWKVAKYLRSNAIVIASNMSILSLGGGQPSRVGAFKIAVDGLIKSGNGAVVASDGFFPKEDNIKLAGKHGIKAIIQPGGSIKDKDIIAVCDKMGISMVFTGIRHFRH